MYFSRKFNLSWWNLYELIKESLMSENEDFKVDCWSSPRWEGVKILLKSLPEDSYTLEWSWIGKLDNRELWLSIIYDVPGNFQQRELRKLFLLSFQLVIIIFMMLILFLKRFVQPWILLSWDLGILFDNESYYFMTNCISTFISIIIL